MSERYYGIHRPAPVPATGAFLRTRRRLVDLGLGLLIGTLAGGGTAVALTAGDTIACQPGQVIVLDADGTWACTDRPAPSPSGTPTPSPSATQTPSPSPSTTSPAPTTSPPSSTTPPATTPPATTPPPSPSPSPSPSPTPGPSGRACPAFPAMPDAACTGVPAGVTLHACGSELRTAGTYDSCLFSGGVQVMANNVTITRSRVLGRVGDGGTGGQYSPTRNLKLVDVEIDGTSINDSTGQAAIGQDGWECLRCNVHHTGRGASMGSSVTIRDSFFHDFKGVAGAHMSAAGSNGGGNNVIVHNTFDCVSVTGQGACSGAFVMYGDFAPVDNWLIQNNLFASPGSYCVYAGSTGVSSGKPYPHGTRLTFLDNRWSRKYTPVCGQYGPVAAWEWNTGNTWTGNAYTDGAPITV